MLKSLYIKIAIFLFIILSIIITSYFLVSSSFTKEANISHVINVAGRERMLIERINKKAIQFVHMDEVAAKKALIVACDEFEKSLYGLMFGNDNLGLVPLANKELKTQLKHVEKHWQLSKSDINQIVSGSGDKQLAIQRINRNSDEIIHHLEGVVKLIEEKGNQSFQGLRTEKTLLNLFNLLFIIILFVTWRLHAQLSKSEKKYRLLVDHAPFGIMILNEKKMKFINKSGWLILGQSHEKDMIEKPIFSFVHPEDQPLVTARLEKVHTHKQVAHTVEARFIKTDGTTVYVEVISIPFPFMGNENILTIFHDITEQKRSETAFEKMYNQLNDIKSALEISSIVTITDDKGIIIYVNDKFCEISQYEKAELIGKTHRVINSQYHSQAFFQDLWKTIQAGRVWEGHIKNRAKDGSYYWVNALIIPFINQTGNPYQYLTIQNDISDQKNAEKEIKILATQDELTQLANRRVFARKLQQEITNEQQVSVLFLDVDRFKFINDSLGHDIGDLLLKEVANRLRGVVAKEGLVSRQGGDEFTMFIKNTNRNFLENICQRIIDEVKHPYLLEGQKIVITCSVGISTFPKDGKTVEKLLKNADIAMYQAKGRGRDNFIFYQKDMSRLPCKVMQMEQELRTAIEAEEFILHYQPKLDLRTNKIIGMEALIRWNHPEMGFLSPGEFIPLAEETGLINSVGKWVLEQACLQNKKWHDEGFSSLIISVNISAYQFKQPNIVFTIAKIIKDSGLAPEFVELEITESISIYREQVIMEKLTALKNLGVNISIDDFGTGYSSLEYLMKFPIDILKIDQSFISNIDGNHQQTPSIMTNAIISLAKSLNMEVVAEGIETIEQMNYLKKHQCDIGQGYFICKPLPADELEVFLSNKQREM